jgi:RHS repeat-associated protein
VSSVSEESLVIDEDPKPTEKAVVSSAVTHRGRKVYELKNHLGNVLAVVSDVKIGLSTSSQVAYYVADVVEMTDYEPFGMPLAMRHFVSGDGYRFGFQGQEGDDEWNGEGSMLAFKYRVHDVRLGRFLSVDPLSGSYPWNSTYAFAENRVIDGIELEGLEYLDAKQSRIYVANGCVGWNYENLFGPSRRVIDQTGYSIIGKFNMSQTLHDEGDMQEYALDQKTKYYDVPREIVLKSPEGVKHSTRGTSYRERITVIGPPNNSKAIGRGRALIAIDAVELGLKFTLDYMVERDREIMENDLVSLEASMKQYNKALETSFVPTQLSNNIGHASNIVNVILQGELGNPGLGQDHIFTDDATGSRYLFSGSQYEGMIKAIGIGIYNGNHLKGTKFSISDYAEKVSEICPYEGPKKE